MLGALLSRFSDEKLKSIQLSLQEEQEIRDIAREEVEKSLRQSGLASMADRLKDDIEKGVAQHDDILTSSSPLPASLLWYLWVKLVIKYIRPVHRGTCVV